MSENANRKETKAEGKLDRMELLDRIELRRFVGRELLLWIWFESELFEGTLSTKEHGSFGLWLEGRLVLNEGRESTVIKGSVPGQHREAKEALLRGKTPERAGIHVSWGDRESTLTLRGETMAFAGLSPPPKPGKEDMMPAQLLEAPKMPPKKKKTSRAEDAILEDDDAAESFYERMQYARDVEALFTAIYRDFLALRLAPEWDKVAFPALQAWVAGEEIDERAYKSARKRALS